MSLWTARAHEVRSQQAQQLLRIAQETADTPTTVQAVRSTPAGDERRLRGIPALSRGVGGAIPGTRPGDSLR